MGNNYLVDFDFTTVHGKGRFVGRKGQIDISTDATAEEVLKDLETIQKMCVDAIHAEKPKWNIFLINVKEIKKMSSEQNVEGCDTTGDAQGGDAGKQKT